MKHLSKQQLSCLIEQATCVQPLNWDGRGALELHTRSCLVKVELNVGWDGTTAGELVAVDCDGATLLLPSDQEQAIRYYHAFRRVAQNTAPALLAELGTLLLLGERHPTVPQIDAVARANRRWVCFYNLERQSVSQFVFDHELSHIFSRFTRLGRDMAQHSVLPEWERACTDDQARHQAAGLAETAFPWTLGRDRRGRRLVKLILVGNAHATDISLEQESHYSSYEEDFCDSVALLLASDRGDGLRFESRGGSRRVPFEQLFPHRAAVIRELLTARAHAADPLRLAA